MGETRRAMGLRKSVRKGAGSNLVLCTGGLACSKGGRILSASYSFATRGSKQVLATSSFATSHMLRGVMTGKRTGLTSGRTGG